MNRMVAIWSARADRKRARTSVRRALGVVTGTAMAIRLVSTAVAFALVASLLVVFPAMSNLPFEKIAATTYTRYPTATGTNAWTTPRTPTPPATR